MIDSNTMYRGPHNARRLVTAVEEDTVSYMLPISHEMRSCALEEFEAWAAEAASEPE